jgi:hypothetical protein
MFKPAAIPTPASLDSSHDLLVSWAVRYLPNLGQIPIELRKFFVERLGDTISDSQRQATANRIRETLLSDCAFAGIQAQRLFSSASSRLDIAEARDLGVQIGQIYNTLLDLYIQDFVFAPLLDALYTLDSQAGREAAARRILPGFTRLTQRIEPLLTQLQLLHMASSNQRAIGFLTTQLHLSRHRILDRLNAQERIWMSSYIQLVEELVCMPWQRICKASMKLAPDSPQVLMVRQVLQDSQTIADRVYQRAVHTFPRHNSRQGQIQSSAVQQSSLRDLNMFQAYIWLCLLEDSMSSIDDELLPLSILVFPCVGVDWSFVDQGISWLIEEIHRRLDSQQRQLLEPYTNRVQQRFTDARPQEADIETLNAQLQSRALSRI